MSAVRPPWWLRAAVAARPLVPWHGPTWRYHRERWPALDDGGSARVSGRYHCAPDQFPPARTWRALYLSLAPEVALGEAVRNGLIKAGDYRLTEVWVELQAVLDLRDPAVIGLRSAELCDDLDRRLPRIVAMLARRRGAEGLLVPSATNLGHNLIVFTNQLWPGAVLRVVGSRQPRLIVAL